MNQNLCLAPSSRHLTALSALSCDCLCGVEAELILSGSAQCLCSKCSNEVVLAKTPTVNGSTGPARLRVGVPSSPPGFSNTWLSGNKLATKSFFSHFRPSTLAGIRQMSTPQVGTRCLHLSMAAHVCTSQDMGAISEALLILFRLFWV